MAQWIGLGLGGVNRARRAPAHVRRKLRDRWLFRRRKSPPDPRSGEEPRA